MAGNNIAVIDTNLLIRYLVEDDVGKADLVERLLSKAEAGEIKIVVPSVVMAELVWVLESYYKLERQEIAELAMAIINTPGIQIDEKSTISSALRTYRNSSIDFIDSWIIEFAKDAGAGMIYTFDRKHFKGIEGIETGSP